MDEAQSKTVGQSVVLFHGPHRAQYTAAMLATADIVVSTYDILVMEAGSFPRGALTRVNWHRWAWLTRSCRARAVDKPGCCESPDECQSSAITMQLTAQL